MSLALFETLSIEYENDDFSFPINTLEALSTTFLTNLANSHYEDEPGVYAFLHAYVGIMDSDNEELKEKVRRLLR